MTSIVKFSNPTKIEPAVWSTFGVSIKDGDNPIGKFGTGLKYAIAVLLRHGRRIKIVSDGEEFVFTAAPITIRGKEFEQCLCNGQPLPFTTHLGHTWELWMAYRELYSNCADEGGSRGTEDVTTIYAEMGDIDHHSVFLEMPESFLAESGPKSDIYHGPSRYIYYRGIRALDLGRESLFTYNVKQADITEDRTFKYSHQIDAAVGDTWQMAQHEEVFKKFFFESKGFWDETIDFDYAHSSLSAVVKQTVDSVRRTACYKQNSINKKVLDTLRKNATPQPVEADERQLRVIEKASEFCGRIGHAIKFPVLVTEDLRGDQLALAWLPTKQIFLSTQVIDQGTKQVAATLIEENTHLSTGLTDCTYGLQSYLFDQIVTMGERLTGEIL